METLVLQTQHCISCWLHDSTPLTHAHTRAHTELLLFQMNIPAIGNMVSGPSFFLFRYAAFIHSSVLLPVIHLFPDCFSATRVYRGLLNPAVSSNSRREAALTHTDAQKAPGCRRRQETSSTVRSALFFLSRLEKRKGCFAFTVPRKLPPTPAPPNTKSRVAARQ